VPSALCEGSAGRGVLPAKYHVPRPRACERFRTLGTISLMIPARVNHGIDSAQAPFMESASSTLPGRTFAAGYCLGDLLFRVGFDSGPADEMRLAAERAVAGQFPAGKTGSACDQNFHLDLRFYDLRLNA